VAPHQTRQKAAKLFQTKVVDAVIDTVELSRNQRYKPFSFVTGNKLERLSLAILCSLWLIL